MPEYATRSSAWSAASLMRRIFRWRSWTAFTRKTVQPVPKGSSKFGHCNIMTMAYAPILTPDPGVLSNRKSNLRAVSGRGTAPVKPRVSKSALSASESRFVGMARKA